MSGMIVAFMAGTIVVNAEPPLLAKVDFEKGDLKAWKLSDPKAFALVDVENGRALGMPKKATYKPKVRSPFGYALWERPITGDFTLDVKVKSTVKDYGHRDLCLFFGFKDPEHFYYVHFAKSADPHAHSIFIVNGTPRLSIGKDRTKGVMWTDGWHQVRLTRRGNEIAAYFDDMKKPVMRATDDTFLTGKVGVGTFDDTGIFDDFVLHATPAAR